MSEEDIFKGYGIRISLKEDFAKVREVLTRIGIFNKRGKTLTQSCHIFHKRGQYALMHFKEMFLFDNKTAEFNTEDEARRNRIVKILDAWGMITIEDDISNDFEICDINQLQIISRKDILDQNIKLIKKYTLGKRKYAEHAS